MSIQWFISMLSCPIAMHLYLRRQPLLSHLHLLENMCMNMPSLSEKLTHLLEETSGDNTDTELICYGVGSIGTCLIARYQFSLFLIMRDHLKVRYKSGIH